MIRRVEGEKEVVAEYKVTCLGGNIQCIVMTATSPPTCTVHKLTSINDFPCMRIRTYSREGQKTKLLTCVVYTCT